MSAYTLSRYCGRSRLQKMCCMSNNSEIPPWTYNVNECLSERRIISIAYDSRWRRTACSNPTSRFPNEMHGPQTLSIGRPRRSSRVEAHHPAIFKSGLRLLWPTTHLFTIAAWDGLQEKCYSCAQLWLLSVLGKGIRGVGELQKRPFLSFFPCKEMIDWKRA